MIEWIKQYFKDSNETFDGTKSENDEKYQFNQHMHCVSTDCILVWIISVICVFYFIYQSINCLLFSNNDIISFYAIYHCCNCIYSLASCHYYNQRIELLAQLWLFYTLYC